MAGALNQPHAKTVHGTTVAVGAAGVLLRGPSGCGKSDLALRLIDRGAALVADDRTELFRDGDHIVARAPDTIRDRLEVRGIGIVRVPALSKVLLELVIDLSSQAERLPEPETTTILGIPLRLLRLSAFESSTPAKIRLAVGAAPGDIVS